LAKHQGHGPLQIKLIAERQEISVKYLEQVMTILKAGGFIRSLRGSKGGYLLAQPPEQIRLDAVFTALEGAAGPAECLEDAGSCSRAADCVTRELWVEVQAAVLKVLGSVTLQDMVEKAQKSEGNFAYQI
jgi:Rrf2 family protein